MFYFIYNNKPEFCIYKIAENESDLNYLNIPVDQYLIINTSQENFNLIKSNTKRILNYNGSSVELGDQNLAFTRSQLQNYINELITHINNFLQAQPQSGKYTQWLNYRNYLINLEVNAIIPTENGFLNTSLEKYIQNTGNPYYSILQIP